MIGAEVDKGVARWKRLKVGGKKKRITMGVPEGYWG